VRQWKGTPKTGGRRVTNDGKKRGKKRSWDLRCVGSDKFLSTLEIKKDENVKGEGK